MSIGTWWDLPDLPPGGGPGFRANVVDQEALEGLADSRNVATCPAPDVVAQYLRKDAEYMARLATVYEWRAERRTERD